MRTISFHKRGLKCPKCRENVVERWNELCGDCKLILDNVVLPDEPQTMVGKRLPAAVIETDDGHKVVVDKFGKEVRDHGYDLKNDPRGYVKTGIVKKKPTII